MTRCIKCQSDEVIPGAIGDQAGHYIRLGVNVYEKPDALLFKGKHSAALTASVCGNCGYVEWYVDSPRELLAAYRQAKP